MLNHASGTLAHIKSLEERATLKMTAMLRGGYKLGRFEIKEVTYAPDGEKWELEENGESLGYFYFVGGAKKVIRGEIEDLAYDQDIEFDEAYEIIKNEK